jgi:plastocyanin
MSSALTILKTVLFASFSAFFISSCNGDTKKAAVEKKVHSLHTVEIKQMKFQPEELVVQKGDTVVWINHDIVPHDVTEESKKIWTSSLMPVGASWSLVIDESARYYCSIHVIMKGELIVQ